jgi:hypothetical protein
MTGLIRDHASAVTDNVRRRDRHIANIRANVDDRHAGSQM